MVDRIGKTKKKISWDINHESIEEHSHWKHEDIETERARENFIEKYLHLLKLSVWMRNSTDREYNYFFMGQLNDKSPTWRMVKFSSTLFIMYFSGRCFSLRMKLIMYSHIGDRCSLYRNRPPSNLQSNFEMSIPGFESSLSIPASFWDKNTYSSVEERVM